MPVQDSGDCQAVIVSKHVDSIPQADSFELCRLDMPSLPAGGVLVRVLYASVDPAMRGWVSNEANYMTVPVGDVMRAHGVAEVIASDHPDYSAGDTVYGFFGWAEIYAAKPEDVWWKIDPDLAPLPAWLNTFGLNGVTAWIGLHQFGRPKAGQTLLVTTAAGGVGSAVGQLGRAAGMRTIGIAGGEDKARLAEAEFGYNQVIDYRGTDDLSAAIRQACPEGIDLYYDNVGGEQADMIFDQLNNGARIVQCGTASVPSWTPWPTGPRRERQVLVKRLSWNGFVAFDHADLFPQALSELGKLYQSGKLTGKEDVREGLASAPGAIAELYSGANKGKLCIRV